MTPDSIKVAPHDDEQPSMWWHNVFGSQRAGKGREVRWTGTCWPTHDIWLNTHTHIHTDEYCKKETRPPSYFWGVLFQFSVVALFPRSRPRETEQRRSTFHSSDGRGGGLRRSADYLQSICGPWERSSAMPPHKTLRGFQEYRDSKVNCIHMGQTLGLHDIRDMLIRTTSSILLSRQVLMARHLLYLEDKPSSQGHLCCTTWLLCYSPARTRRKWHVLRRDGTKWTTSECDPIQRNSATKATILEILCAISEGKEKLKTITLETQQVWERTWSQAGCGT